MLNFGAEIIELKDENLDLVTGGKNQNGNDHPIADGILLGLLKAGYYVVACPTGTKATPR